MSMIKEDSKKLDLSKLENATTYIYTYTNVDEIVDYKFLINLREKLGLTRSVFASILGVDQSMLELWEDNLIFITAGFKRLLYLLNSNPNLIEHLYKTDAVNQKSEEGE